MSMSMIPWVAPSLHRCSGAAWWNQIRECCTLQSLQTNQERFCRQFNKLITLAKWRREDGQRRIQCKEKHTSTTAPSCLALYKIQNLAPHKPQQQYTLRSAFAKHQGLMFLSFFPMLMRVWWSLNYQGALTQSSSLVTEIQHSLVHGKLCLALIFHLSRAGAAAFFLLRIHSFFFADIPTLIMDACINSLKNSNKRKASIKLHWPLRKKIHAPHNSAHALPDSRVPTLGGVQGQAPVCDPVPVMSSRHRSGDSCCHKPSGRVKETSHSSALES